MFMTYLVFKFIETEKKQYLGFLGLCKVIINHSVIITAIGKINCHWSALVGTIVDILADIFTYMSHYTAFDCILNSNNPSNAFFRTLVFTVLFPGLLILWFTLLFGLYGMCRGSFDGLRNKLICMIVITHWLLIQDICHVCFGSFACINVEQNSFTEKSNINQDSAQLQLDSVIGKSRLFADPEIICWEGVHLNYVLSVTFPAIIIYLIVIPTYLFLKLRRNLEIIKNIHSIKDMPRGDQFQMNMFV